MNKRRLRLLLALAFAALPAAGCRPVPTPTKPAPTTIVPKTTSGRPPGPSPTSIVRNRVDESLTCGGTFKLTVTSIQHLSNAVLLNITVENISRQTAAWTPQPEALYILDGDTRVTLRQASDLFESGGSLKAGASSEEYLVFDLPHGPFRFYCPGGEPAYIVIQPPR